MDPDERGRLHRPAGAPRDGLVLTHGAGGDADAPFLIALARAFAAAGVTVLRSDLPFRRKRPHGPPSAHGAARDREGLRVAVEALAGMVPGRRFLGGHSYGARQATRLAAEAPGVAAALLLLAYPLHPPRRPHEPRTAHFPRLTTPAFFVHGTRDPFGSPDELRAALGLIPAPTGLFVVDGAGHDLGGRRRAESPAADVAGAVVTGFRAFVDALPGVVGGGG